MSEKERKKKGRERIKGAKERRGRKEKRDKEQKNRETNGGREQKEGKKEGTKNKDRSVIQIQHTQLLSVCSTVLIQSQPALSSSEFTALKRRLYKIRMIM